MSAAVASVVEQFEQRLDTLPRRLAHRRYFLATYTRTTEAVGEAIDHGAFEDPGSSGALKVAVLRS